MRIFRSSCLDKFHLPAFASAGKKLQHPSKTAMVCAATGLPATIPWSLRSEKIWELAIWKFESPRSPLFNSRLRGLEPQLLTTFCWFPETRLPRFILVIGWSIVNHPFWAPMGTPWNSCVQWDDPKMIPSIRFPPELKIGVLTAIGKSRKDMESQQRLATLALVGGRIEFLAAPLSGKLDQLRLLTNKKRRFLTIEFQDFQRIWPATGIQLQQLGAVDQGRGFQESKTEGIWVGRPITSFWGGRS